MVTLIGFVTRKVFVDNIGVQYLGLNGLLSNILGIMSLLEGGFATSVVYNMYKPLAEDDRPRILALLQLYRRVYRWIAAGVILMGISLYPFIGYFMKDADDLSYVGVIYFIFLFNSVINYFTAYKWSLINASQQVYKLTVINLVYQVGLSITKLAILYYTKNYILFLVIEAFFNVAYNIAVVRKANSLFPYVKTRERYSVDAPTRNNIVTNIKALFINKVGGYFMHQTDNIIISSFVGIATVGLYSNYTLVMKLIKSLVNQVLDSYSESVGNLIATESPDKVFNVFKSCFFVNFILVSIPLVILFNAFSPLIDWWLGPEYKMADMVMGVILLNFYVDNIRITALTFKTKAGIFVQDRWTPFLQGVINVILSLVFVKLWGLIGVLVATAISILSIGFWQFPRLCYKHIFHKPLWDYFKRLSFFTLVGAISLLLSWFLCRLMIVGGPLVKVICNVAVSGIVVLAVYWLFFHRIKEYEDMKVYFLHSISLLMPAR